MTDMPGIDLLPLLDAVTVSSPTRFTIAGADVACTTSPPDDLERRLQQELYQHAYCHRFTGKRHEPKVTAQPDGGLIEPLARANSTVERWDPGWRMTRRAAGVRAGPLRRHQRHRAVSRPARRPDRRADCSNHDVRCCGGGGQFAGSLGRDNLEFEPAT